MISTMDELLQKINILDVVSQNVKLRKAGKDYIGLCPFHKEKTPSFTVSVEKQIYYCFGCHEGGNAVNFIMKYENMSFHEALESLAQEYGVEMKRSGDSKRPRQYDALLKLAEHYHRSLKENAPALKYLLGRGIDKDIIDEFMIGFSDRNKQGLKAFMKGAAIPNDHLLNTGILRIKDGEIYDIFRGRVTIPIIDVNKKVIGFGARAMEKDAIPKYINSPESPVFSKRSCLFGIDKARKHIVESNEVFIVEGYFDLIALYREGIRNVVSTLGTSITDGQLSKLRNYTENITLMLDGDEAGAKSALRLIETISDMDINGNMVVLPEGHDPDSLVRHEGGKAAEKVMGEKKPILDYFFEYYMARCKLSALEGKLSFVRTVLPHVEAIKNAVKKRLYIKKISELTGVEERYFFNEIKGEAEKGGGSKKDPANLIEKSVVGVLMNHPSLMYMLKGKEVIGWIKDNDVGEVLSKMFQWFEEKKHLEIDGFISVLEKDEMRDFVVQTSFDMAACDEKESMRILSDYLKYVEKRHVKEQAQRITEKLSEAEKRGDEKAVMELLQQKRQVLAFIKSNFI
jgi:DNA primase